MTEEELEEATQKLDELREEIREDLAADLGGCPEDYDATRLPVADSGE